MNRVIMMGRIASDIEQKTTPQGTNLCSFRLAVERNYQKKGEERVSDFFNVTAWRTTGEFISRYFSKGRMILIEGEMQTSQYTDKNGNPATWYEIIADNVYFTGEKANGVAQTAPAVSTPAAAAPSAGTGAGQSAPMSGNDDYPF